MYTRKLTFRCRPSTFRAICNALSEIMTEEIVNLLRQLNIYQFTKIPAFQQDTPIIIQIMSCWNINRQAFYIGGQYLGFTADEVALILGMPNRGKEVIWQTTPLSKYNSINIKNKIKKVKNLQDSTKFVKLYIKFLITNLFFPYHNYKVPRDLYMYGENIYAFPNYNWPEAIWRFMLSQFDVIAEKIMMQKPLGYMSGFLTILMVWFFEHTSVIIPNRPAAKPRMLRWSKSNWWNTKFCTETFNRLHQQHVFETFREVSKEERGLLSTSYPFIHSSAILTRSSRSAKIESPPASPPYSPETFNRLQQRHVFETFREVSKEERGLLSTTYPFIHSSAILTRRSRSPKIESHPASPPYFLETFNRLQQQHVFETFREISKEERGLPSTSYPFIHSPAILTRRSLSPKIESPPASPPYTHHSHVGTSYVSATKLSSTTTPTRLSIVNIFDLLKSLESGLENRLDKLENALISRMSDVEFILKNVEESLSGHRSPTNANNVDKGIGAPTFEPMQNEGTLQTSFPEDEQVVHEISQAQEVDLTTKSLLDSLVLRIKTGQRSKRKAISTPYTDGERKKMSKRQKKVSPKKVQGEKGHQMKRLFPWEEVVTISLDDSSDSDFEEHKQGRVKRDKKDCSSENLGDIMSEGTLIRMAGMYQEYMKRIPIPTFSASVVPFTSWQSLAESLKQLYGQPLHFLTNSLLKQWDRERFGSDNERQPLDAVVHPVKAQTLIWLTEELHRLTASPYYLAKLWASDPMYHSQIDPFLSC